MINTILGSFCSFFNWIFDIRSQIRHMKIPVNSSKLLFIDILQVSNVHDFRNFDLLPMDERFQDYS